MKWLAGLAVVLLLSACDAETADDRPETARDFPQAWRPVSDLGSNEFGNEDQRDNRGEAEVVMDLAAIKAGTTVADIGAGEGYYTVRLAERVGAKGACWRRTSILAQFSAWGSALSANGSTMSR